MTDVRVGTRGRGREGFQLQIADQMMGGDDDRSVNWQQRALCGSRERIFYILNLFWTKTFFSFLFGTIHLCHDIGGDWPFLPAKNDAFITHLHARSHKHKHVNGPAHTHKY